MNNEDSSTKKNASDVSSSSTNAKTTEPTDLSKRISNFGDKVNSFIEELRSTGEAVFPINDIGPNSKDDHDKIVESLLDGHIDDDLNLIEDENHEDLENQIIELTDKIKSLNNVNSKLRQEIVDLQLQFHTMAKHSDGTESLTVEIIENEKNEHAIDEENVHEIKEVSILNYYNPEHWDRIIQLNNENKLTLRILEILKTEEKVQLIIIALMLQADPAEILNVMKNLQDIGVVDLGYKSQGGLNPMVTLIEHF